MPQMEALPGFEHFSIGALVNGSGSLLGQFGQLLAPVIVIGSALLVGYFALRMIRKGD